MKHQIFVFGAFYCLLLCLTLQAQKEQTAKAAPPKTPVAYSNRIIPGSQDTFGFDIYANKKILIHQPNIPAVLGNEGFKTKMAAEKVAQLMIQKLKKGEMPPTVSIEEMKKLKAI